jgi:hypothetical protein
MITRSGIDAIKATFDGPEDTNDYAFKTIRALVKDFEAALDIMHQIAIESPTTMADGHCHFCWLDVSDNPFDTGKHSAACSWAKVYKFVSKRKD